MAKVHNGEEILRKVSTPRVGHTNDTDRQQMNFRQQSHVRVKIAMNEPLKFKTKLIRFLNSETTK